MENYKSIPEGVVSKQEIYSILAKNRAQKVPETCKPSKFPELFAEFIWGKIYFETAPYIIPLADITGENRIARLGYV